MQQLKILFDSQAVARFCRRHHIRKLSFFGSVLRPDFRPDSDVDVLVEFDAAHTPGLFQLAGMERELSAILGGRKVDLRTPQDLSPYFRAEVLASARVQYTSALESALAISDNP